MSAASVFGIRVSALPAWRALTRAMLDAGPVPCASDPEAWTGDDPEEHAYAARACRRCPVLDQCRTFATANGETSGVWGGADRTPALGRPITQRGRKIA